MQLKTILNHVEKQTGFVYAEARFSEDHSKILVTRKPHARSRPICSGCGKKRPGYDTRPTRRFEFIPLRAIALFFLRHASSRLPSLCGRGENKEA